MRVLTPGTALFFTVTVYAKNESQKELIIELHDMNLKYRTIQDIIIHKRGRKMSRNRLKKVKQELDFAGYSETKIKEVLSFDEKTI